MKRLVLILTATALSVATAATNLVSNTITITNRNAIIVTYVMDTNGVAHVNDPTGRLIGTAEERALKVAADGQSDIASAAQVAAESARFEWDEFAKTNDTHIVYIAADFTQDLPALAPNFCGWIAGSFYDRRAGEDHYFVWFNRELDYPPSLHARIRHIGGETWLENTEWADWETTHLVQGVACRELVVPRRNADCVLRTGNIITFGGKEGFDADIHKCNIEVSGTPSATTDVSVPLFYAVTHRDLFSKNYAKTGTVEVVRAYTNGFVKVENGFFKEPSNE